MLKGLPLPQLFATRPPEQPAASELAQHARMLPPNPLQTPGQSAHVIAPEKMHPLIVSPWQMQHVACAGLAPRSSVALSARATVACRTILPPIGPGIESPAVGRSVPGGGPCLTGSGREQCY